MKLFSSFNRTAQRAGAGISNSGFRELSAGASWRSLIAFAAAAALPLAIVTTPLDAASGPPIKVGETVEVQGVVEVLNDMLREPYRQSRGVHTIAAGTIPVSAACAFDVPVGKRLIVETISLEVRVTENHSVSVSMNLIQSGGGLFPIVLLPVQKQGSGFSSLSQLTPDFFTGTHSVKLRVDGTAADKEISFSVARNAASGTVQLQVSICGYLVDIPSPAP